MSDSYSMLLKLEERELIEWANAKGAQLAARDKEIAKLKEKLEESEIMLTKIAMDQTDVAMPLANANLKIAELAETIRRYKVEHENEIASLKEKYEHALIEIQHRDSDSDDLTAKLAIAVEALSDVEVDAHHVENCSYHGVNGRITMRCDCFIKVVKEALAKINGDKE